VPTGGRELIMQVLKQLICGFHRITFLLSESPAARVPTPIFSRIVDGVPSRASPSRHEIGDLADSWFIRGSVGTNTGEITKPVSRSHNRNSECARRQAASFCKIRAVVVMVNYRLLIFALILLHRHETTPTRNTCLRLAFANMEGLFSFFHQRIRVLQALQVAMAQFGFRRYSQFPPRSFGHRCPYGFIDFSNGGFPTPNDFAAAPRLRTSNAPVIDRYTKAFRPLNNLDGCNGLHLPRIAPFDGFGHGLYVPSPEFNAHWIESGSLAIL